MLGADVATRPKTNNQAVPGTHGSMKQAAGNLGRARVRRAGQGASPGEEVCITLANGLGIDMAPKNKKS